MENSTDSISQIVGVSVGFSIWGCLLLTFGVLALRSAQQQFLKVRSISLLVMSAILGFLASLVLSISLLNPFPSCLVEGIFYSLLLPVAFGPMILMIPDLILRSKLNDEKENRSKGQISNYWKWRPFCQPRVKILIMFCAGIVQVGIYLGLYFGTSPLPGSCQRLPVFIFDGAMLLSFLPFGFILRQIREVTDPFLVQKHLIGTWILSSPLIVVTVIYPFAPDIFTPYFDFRYIFIISNAWMFWWNIPMVYIYFQVRKPKRGGMIRLANSLSTIFATDYDIIVEFAKKTWCHENILFYEKVREFKDLDLVGENLFNKAVEIFKEYIGDDAPLQVNIEYRTVEDIRNKIANDQIDKEIFNKAFIEVQTIIERDIVTRWKHENDA